MFVSVYVAGLNFESAATGPGGSVRATLRGENTVSIKVRNLPANRIAWMDREGVIWRIFKDVNIAAVNSRQVVTL